MLEDYGCAGRRLGVETDCCGMTAQVWRHLATACQGFCHLEAAGHLDRGAEADVDPHDPRDRRADRLQLLGADQADGHDRHARGEREVRDAGARIRLIPDGDVAGAISVAWPDSGADILFGIGGTPEGVIAAAALKCMGGVLAGRLWPRNDAERDAAADLGYDLDAVLMTDDLVAGDNCFFAATGITDGDLVKGVHYANGQAHTQSLVMRSKSGTVRFVEAHHSLDKLQDFSAVDY